MAASKAQTTSLAVLHCPRMQLMEVAATTAMAKSSFILLWLNVLVEGRKNAARATGKNTVKYHLINPPKGED